MVPKGLDCFVPGFRRERPKRYSGSITTDRRCRYNDGFFPKTGSVVALLGKISAPPLRKAFGKLACHLIIRRDKTESPKQLEAQ